MASFILKDHEGGMGWGIGGGGGGVLHKLSSRSACIAWPTVQRDEWNVGQTPPPLSFFLSVCILLFPLSETPHHCGFLENREKRVVLI